MVCPVGEVRGMAEIDNKVFIVFADSSNIEVCDALTFNQLSVITVQGLINPQDIVVCHHDRQLYVAEYYCIWRVSVDGHWNVKWLTLSSTDRFCINTLSLTSESLLVTSRVPPALRQYNTVDRQLLNIRLPQYVWYLYHAVETTRGTFVVGHGGTLQNKYQDVVSELFS